MQPPASLIRITMQKTFTYYLSLFYLVQGRKTVSEKATRQGSGARAIAIDRRAQIAKIRLLLFLSILCSASLAVVLRILLGH